MPGENELALYQCPDCKKVKRRNPMMEQKPRCPECIDGPGATNTVMERV